MEGFFLQGWRNQPLALQLPKCVQHVWKKVSGNALVQNQKSSANDKKEQSKTSANKIENVRPTIHLYCDFHPMLWSYIHAEVERSEVLYIYLIIVLKYNFLDLYFTHE